jgi:hypothetical protein
MAQHVLAGAACASLLFAGAGLADPPPLKSGPPVGARNNRTGFYPQYVAGPGTGQRRCPV